MTAAIQLLRLRGRPLPQRWVGLDLGSSSIKLAALETGPTGVRLVTHLIQELPSTADGHPPDRLSWLQPALKDVGGHEVHVALSGPQVAVRRVRVPPMSARELPEAVKWEVKDQLPFPVQEAALGYRVIGEVWEKDLRKQDILVAAAPRSLLDETVELVRRAGSRAVSVVPAHAAVWTCVAGLIPELTAGSVVLIEMGQASTHVTIVRDGAIAVVRDLAIGSGHLTASLIGEMALDQGRVLIDQAKAEALKRRYGILTHEPEGTSDEGIPLFQLASLMRPVLEQLLTELSRFLDFYKVQTEDGGISRAPLETTSLTGRALLCGGGATLKQLQPFLADGLGLTVEVFNPLMRLGDRAAPLEPEQIAEGGPRLTTAVGAALAHGAGLNLLPKEALRPRVAIPAIPTGMKHLLIKAVAGAALGGYLLLQGTALVLGARLDVRQATWKSLGPAYAQATRILEERTRLERSITQAQQFVEQQPVWEAILKDLADLTPAAIQLRELMITSGQGEPSPRTLTFAMKGTAASGDRTAHGSLSQFIEDLETSLCFANVELVTSQGSNEGASATLFELIGGLE